MSEHGLILKRTDLSNRQDAEFAKANNVAGFIPRETISGTLAFLAVQIEGQKTFAVRIHNVFHSFHPVADGWHGLGGAAAGVCGGGA